jgi:hypothetical protein
MTVANSFTSCNQVEATLCHFTQTLPAHQAMWITNNIGKFSADLADIGWSFGDADFICWYLQILNSPPLFFSPQRSTKHSCMFSCKKMKEVSWGFEDHNQRAFDSILPIISEIMIIQLSNFNRLSHTWEWIQGVKEVVWIWCHTAQTVVHGAGQATLTRNWSCDLAPIGSIITGL